MLRVISRGRLSDGRYSLRLKAEEEDHLIDLIRVLMDVLTSRDKVQDIHLLEGGMVEFACPRVSEPSVWTEIDISLGIVRSRLVEAAAHDG